VIRFSPLAAGIPVEAPAKAGFQHSAETEELAGGARPPREMQDCWGPATGQLGLRRWRCLHQPYRSGQWARPAAAAGAFAAHRVQQAAAHVAFRICAVHEDSDKTDHRDLLPIGTGIYRLSTVVPHWCDRERATGGRGRSARGDVVPHAPPSVRRVNTAIPAGAAAVRGAATVTRRLLKSTVTSLAVTPAGVASTLFVFAILTAASTAVAAGLGALG
jgi:hypothetical protein